MNLSEIIILMGEKEYQAARVAARRAALDPNYGGDQEESFVFDSMIAHDISDLIWDDTQTTSSAKLRLALQVYEEMPCYANLMYIKTNFNELSSSDHAEFWKWARIQLEGKDSAVIPPLAYSLWCDFFEDDRTVEEAWNNLISPLPNDQALQAILLHSGPVPFDLKWKLYGQLLSQKKWHYFIYRSLLASEFDVYGQIDRRKAERLLNQLRLPYTEGMNELRDRLRPIKGSAQSRSVRRSG